jgi:signal transduction histidine kinase
LSKFKNFIFKDLFNLATIRGQIASSFLFYIAIIIFIIIIFFFHQNRIEGVKETTVKVEKLYTNTLQLIKLERDFNNFEANNIDFYRTGQSSSLKEHKLLLKSLKSDLNSLSKSSDESVRISAAELSLILDNYGKTFLELVDKLRERGFKDYGLEGTMRTYAHELENKGDRVDMVTILGMRKNEKDFLLRNETSYVFKVKKLAESFRLEIMTSNLSLKEKKQLQETLDLYLEAFDKLVQTKKEVGNGADSGLSRLLKNHSRSIFNHLDLMTTSARHKEASILNNLKITFLVIIAICIVACIVFSYFISHKLTKPISDLSTVISEVQKGNFSSRVQLLQNESPDEVGELTRNFNSMVELVRRSFVEIKEKNVRLEIQNLKLTSINEKVAASEKSLKESNAIKDKFFSIIAHDLKGPLATITSFLQIMINYSDGFTEEERTRLAKDMHKSVENLSALLENLLQWARSQMGHIDFTPKKFPLSKSVQKTYDLLNARATGKLIELDVKVDKEIIVFADENMLDFVFRNLLSNALKFTNPGGKIQIKASVHDQMVEVSVSDNGIGINEEDQAKLFRTDYHLTKPGTFKEEGTGLGLILCKEFVEKNGGKIWVESKPNQGTEFKFTLQAVNELVKN